MFALFMLAAVGMIHPPQGTESTSLVAGGGAAGDGSPALQSRLISPFGLVETPSGSIVFVEMTGHRVREIAPDGTLRTIAGTGHEGKTGDGPAASSEFNGM